MSVFISINLFFFEGTILHDPENLTFLKPSKNSRMDSSGVLPPVLFKLKVPPLKMARGPLFGTLFAASLVRLPTPPTGMLLATITVCGRAIWT